MQVAEEHSLHTAAQVPHLFLVVAAVARLATQALVERLITAVLAAAVVENQRMEETTEALAVQRLLAAAALVGRAETQDRTEPGFKGVVEAGRLAIPERL